MGSGHHNSNNYSSIPSTLMLLSFTSELQETSGCYTFKPEGGVVLVNFLGGVVSAYFQASALNHSKLLVGRLLIKVLVGDEVLNTL